MNPSIEEILESILSSFPEINKPFKRFLLKIVLSCLGCKGKYNFRNLARYSPFCEKTLQRWFSTTDFCFTQAQQKLIAQYVKPACSFLALDASFITKAGKKTFGLGWFYNGKAKKYEKGLEVSLIALVDVNRNQAFALDLVQTKVEGDKVSEDTRIDHAVGQVKSVATWAKDYTRYIVADGYYAKKKFLEGINAEDMHLITRLRADANLRYKYTGEPIPGQKPKQYAGKVAWKNDQGQKVVPAGFVKIKEQEGVELYQAKCHSPQFKCWLNVVYVYHVEANDYVLLCATDLEQAGTEIYQYYRQRFQIEFIFRDTKQHLGLSHCQSLKQARLSFHFGLCMLVYNLSKLRVLSSLEENSFSLYNIKAYYFNKRWLENLSVKLGLDLNSIKQHPNYEQVLNWGVIQH